MPPSRVTPISQRPPTIRRCANTSFTAKDWKPTLRPKRRTNCSKRSPKTPVFPALTLAVNYMDAPATAETAALVVKTVAAKNPGMGGQTVAAALKKALEVYVELAKADADAGYAVDEIKGLMAKLPEAGFEPLSLEPENRKAVVGNPETRKAMKPKALAKAQLEADAAMAQKWSLTDGIPHGPSKRSRDPIPEAIRKLRDDSRLENSWRGRYRGKGHSADSFGRCVRYGYAGGR